VSDDGEKGNGADERRSSRPESAASRRARRRPADGKGAVKGKSAGSTPTGRKDTPAATKRDRGEPKQPLPKRVARYLREVVAELRKVIWPTRKQLVTYTIVVIVFVAFMISLVAGLDWVFGKAMFALFG